MTRRRRPSRRALAASLRPPPPPSTVAEAEMDAEMRQLLGLDPREPHEATDAAPGEREGDGATPRPAPAVQRTAPRATERLTESSG